MDLHNLVFTFVQQACGQINLGTKLLPLYLIIPLSSGIPLSTYIQLFAIKTVCHVPLTVPLAENPKAHSNKKKL